MCDCNCEEEFDQWEPIKFCVICGGLLLPLGTLGRVLWLRCQDCGIEVSEEGGE